jgi:serine/threonine-protein kinase HipA
MPITQGLWTSQHQLSVPGKRDAFVAEDLLVLAKRYGVKKAEGHLKEVAKAVHSWTKFAGKAGIDNQTIERIKAVLRLGLVKT